MFKYLIVFLLVISSLNANTDQIVENEKAKNAAIILNYLHGSLNKIVLYNDKIVLEEEYNNIINNLNLTVIEDEELVQVITYLMDTLTQFRLSEMDRAKFRKEYEEKLEGALSGALTGLVNVRGGNPVELGINAILGIGSAYFNYKNTQKNLKNDLESSTYELDKKAFTDLNDIRKEFILTYWGIMKRYNIPDKWRVSEKQFTRLINILKDDDSEKVYRQLLRMKNELSVLPMYWYELSLIARKLNKKEDELSYINKFEKLDNKLFRQNSMYSLLLANKISYLDLKKDREEIKSLLEKIYAIDTLNHNKKLFSAMKYIQLEEYDRADFLLTQNVDDNFIPEISGKLKVDMYVKTSNKDFEKTLLKLIKDQNISAEESLYYLGKRPTRLLINEITEEIKKIKIELNKSIYGKEDLIVELPKNWVVKDVEDTELILVINQNNHNFSTIGLEDNFIKYQFGEVIDLYKLSKIKEDLISFKFNHKNVPVELIYKMILIEGKKEEVNKDVKKEENENDSYFSNISNKISKTVDDIKNNEFVKDVSVSAVEYVIPSYNVIKNTKEYIFAKVSFTPVKILTDNKCFDIQNEMKECK